MRKINFLTYLPFFLMIRKKLKPESLYLQSNNASVALSSKSRHYYLPK